MKVTGRWSRIAFFVGIAVLFTSQPAYAKEGWTQQGDNWKYERPDGGFISGEWLQSDGLWYHFDENGNMQTGWVKEAEGWYYFGLDGILNTAADTADSLGRPVKLLEQNGDYYMDGSQYIFNPETDGNLVFSSGNMNDTRVIAALKGVLVPDALSERELATYQKAKNFLDQNISASDSNVEKARKIFDYLNQTAVYQDTGKMDDDCPYSVLVDGIGICGGFARSFKVLANGAGLECRYVGNGYHAYNEVFTDDWKMIDASSAIDDADFYLKAVHYSCDGCGESGVLPPGGFYTCPCGNTFGRSK
ncbi:transglutaminase domain-containing protein (plasmid) [Enterocloster clostridioformis]